MKNLQVDKMENIESGLKTVINGLFEHIEKNKILEFELFNRI